MGKLSEPFVVVEIAELSCIHIFFFAMGRGEGGC